jgi:homoserine O-succinyltransferase
MATFYRPWSDVDTERFDGFIITGAPVERLPYHEVSYWPELCAILDWTQTHVHRCLTICWAAQAALFHFHDLPKRDLPRKAFGVFQHRNLAPTSPYLRGFSDLFDVPASRWTEVCPSALADAEGLQVLADSVEAGPGLVADHAHGMLHMFNHLEYDTGTLADEYHRDGPAQFPAGYFPADDPARSPENRWRGHAHLLFANWINEIYQTTPFDIDATVRLRGSGGTRGKRAA